jgi:hypothetical protein
MAILGWDMQINSKWKSKNAHLLSNDVVTAIEAIPC